MPNNRRNQISSKRTRPTAARRSAESIQPTRPVALDVVLKKLAPFLETLSAGELADIPKAAEALARRPCGTRALFHPRPAQPVEVVFARVNREIVGVLLLRHKWMGEAFAQYCNAEVQQTARWPQIVLEACDSWLEQLRSDLGLWLSRQAEVLPERFYPRLYIDGADDFLDVLDELTPEEIDRWLWMPIVLRGLQDLARNGNPQQRGKLRKVLLRWAPDGRGRPTKAVDELRAVAVAQAVAEAESRLREGFKVCCQLRKIGGYNSSREVIEPKLVTMGYDEYEVRAIVEGKKTLSRAACRLVAFKSNGRYTVASVSAIASLGRKRLRSGW